MVQEEKNSFTKQWNICFEKKYKQTLNKNKFAPRQIIPETLTILNVLFLKKELDIKELSRILMTLHEQNFEYFGITDSAIIISELDKLLKRGLIAKTKSKGFCYKITKKGVDFRNEINGLWYQKDLYWIQSNPTDKCKYLERIRQETE